MKTTINLLAGIIALLCCSTASAQYLIYSNSFANPPALPYTSVYNTAPTYVSTTNLTGANLSAVWICTYTNPAGGTINNPGASVPPYGAGTVYLNGTIGTNMGCALLPLAVQTNAVYILNSSLTIPASMSVQVEMGFSTGDASQFNMDTLGECRFNDGPVEGYAWDYIQTTKTTQLFKGGGTANDDETTGDLTPVAGTYLVRTILSTLNNTNIYAFTNMIGHGATNYWFAYSYISSPNGTSPTNQIGTNLWYAASASGAPPMQLNYCGLGSAGTGSGTTPGIQWNWFTVSTPLLPIIVNQPTSATANQNTSFTNSVLALADTNGGPLVYQWYTNGVPLSNGGNVSGATSASLVINPLQAYDAGTNFYVVITNTFGAVTSAPVSLAVIGAPLFSSATPQTISSPMILFGGTNVGATAYLGSTPRFSVSTIGLPPITYFWLTNGVAVGGANSSTFAYNNCQLNGPATFSCIASNSLGTATNTWPVAYLLTPTNPFPQAVLAAAPIAYWRLDDTNVDGADNGSGDDGYICHDFQSGNNGIYTNTILANPGYSPITDPSQSSAEFGFLNNGISDSANSMGTNLDFSSSANGEFTVAIWANGEGLGETANAGMITKGYFNGEEYDLDFAPGTFAARFETHNAAGTAANANSSETLTDSNWHLIVGVCDETNGNVFIYVDGALAGYASITPGSGIVHSPTTPVMIGDRLQNATDSGASQQFYGDLDDAQVYGYAMSASQVASLYQASGAPVVPSVILIAPLPPTNVLYMTNATITIPATAAGTPPLGYYWTNLTTGTVIASGTTNAYANLNATLTIQDVNGNLNGDLLELVVTNSGASTNWIVNNLTVLTNPPTAIPLGYTNAIVYSNSFDADQLTIGGQQASAFDDLFGTNEWICTYTNGLQSSGTVYENGTLATNGGNALLPFTPVTGYIYTMSGTLIIPSAQGDWVSMGFAQSAAQSSAPTTGRFTDSPINGEPWMYIQVPNVVLEHGPGTSGTSFQLSGLPASYPETNTIQLVLNTVTNNAWVASAYIYTNSSANAVGIGTNYYNSSLPIAYAGIGQNVFPGSEQWVSWSLTAQPVAVPPYLLITPPTNSIVLTNATITLPATAFGSAVLGYSWINNSTILASGTTNNMAPLPASLSIASTSLSAGKLELVVTNAYGTNITSITLVSPIATNGTNMWWGVTNGTIYLSWPSDHTGWTLQAETNGLGVGLSTNWANVSGSTTTNMFSFPMNLTNGSVFYRLIYP